MYSEIDSFIRYLSIEKGCSEKTIESYYRDLSDLASFFSGAIDETGHDYFLSFQNTEDVEIENILTADLKEYVAFLFDKNFEVSSIQRKISAVRSFFRFLFNRDYIKKNPAYGLRNPKGKRRVPGFLTMKQIDEMMNFDLKTLSDYRDRALLETFFSTGCRVSEICEGQLKYLDLKEQTLKVKGKGGYDRITFLGRDSVFWLNKYLKMRKQKYGHLKGGIFLNKNGNPISRIGVYNLIKKRSREAGLAEFITPHTLRHSFATELMENGADIRVVQEMLGHKNLSTTQIYTHMSRSHLKKVYERCHPHA